MRICRFWSGLSGFDSRGGLWFDQAEFTEDTVANIGVINVGKWSVGRDNTTGNAVLKLDWTDKPSLALIIPMEDAEAIGKALRVLARKSAAPKRPH